MPDATIVTLESQLDALAARIATLEWRHEQLIRGLTRAGERLNECIQPEYRSETASMVASTAAMRQANERSDQVQKLEELERQEQLERERGDSVRELTRRVGRLEGGKR